MFMWRVEGQTSQRVTNFSYRVGIPNENFHLVKGEGAKI
jgi:hypothetical protein